MEYLSIVASAYNKKFIYTWLKTWLQYITNFLLMDRKPKWLTICEWLITHTTQRGVV